MHYKNINKDNVKKFNNKTRLNNEDGFSLMELVIAIGLVLILTVGGLIGYNFLNRNAKEATTEAAAASVLRKAMVNESDIMSDANYKTAEIEYNQNAQKNDNSNDPKITVEANIDEEKNEIVVIAMYKGTNIKVEKRAKLASSIENVIDDIEKGEEEDNKEDEKDPVVGEQVISKFTYKCDVESTGSLLPITVSDKEVEVYATNSSTNQTEKVSLETDPMLGLDLFSTTFKAGIEYKVKAIGQYDILASIENDTIGVGKGLSNCLVSIDEIGEDTGVEGVMALGGENFVDVPDSIPSSVTSLSGAFAHSPKFNDSSVSKWDVSNVKEINSLFENATSFNQPLDNFNEAKIGNLTKTFKNAKSFNQNISDWDVSNVKNMAQIFNGATSFNSDIGNWDVSNVTLFSRAFEDAHKFNQDLNDWNVENAESLTGMFRKAYDFNKPLNKWGEKLKDKYISIDYMLEEATSYNQDLSSWVFERSKVSNGLRGFNDGGILQENYYPKLIG